MKNKLIDLNDHLFALLENLLDKDLKDEDLDNEIKRSKAVSAVAGQIIGAMTLALDAQKALGDDKIKQIPEALTMSRAPAIPDHRNGKAQPLQ